MTFYLFTLYLLIKFLFIYADIMYMLHKKMLHDAQKTVVLTKNNVLHRSYVAHQNCVSQKKICQGN